MSQIEKDGGADFDNTHRHKDGHLVPFAIRNRAIQVRGKTYWLANWHDMSQRLDAEQALRRSEAILQRAQRVGRLGSWSIDVATGRIEWSAETYRMFEVEPDQPMTLERLLGFVHPEDRAKLSATWNAALGGAAYDIERADHLARSRINHRLLRRGHLVRLP